MEPLSVKTSVPSAYPSTFPSADLPNLFTSSDPCVLTITSPAGPCLMPYFVPDTAPSRLSSMTPSRDVSEGTKSDPSSTPILRLYKTTDTHFKGPKENPFIVHSIKRQNSNRDHFTLLPHFLPGIIPRSSLPLTPS